MRAGIISLVLAYVLSQFYRAFLAVMSPVLMADMGLTAGDLADASGLWFLAFAAMQIPVGVALDRVGPRRTAAVLFAIGAAGGAALFAAAQSALEVKLAMALIGLGCAPVLMANYYIFARAFSPAVFGTLAGVVIGIGSLGNIASSLPLAFAVELLGWRGSLWGLAALSLLVAIGIALLVRDPARLPPGPRGSVLDILRIPALWFILPIMAVNYLPAAGLRGLWAGPYLGEVFGLEGPGIGQVTLVMGIAMVLGNLAYGPLDRVLRTRKWLIFGGNFLTMLALAILALHPTDSVGFSTLMLAAIGFFGASFPMVMAHGRAFFPPHLLGRGVTLLNFFGIGATGLMQLATGRVYDHWGQAQAADQAFPVIFALYAALLAVALCLYLFAKDRID